MTALDKKDLHVHTHMCPHRKSDAPAIEYLYEAERKGLCEIAFNEHGPFPAPLSLTKYEKDENLSDEETEAYFRYMHKLKEEYKGPVKFKVGLEIDYCEGYEKEVTRTLQKYGPWMEDGLLSVHNILLDGSFLPVDFRHFIKLAAQSMGPRKLSELYYRTLIASVKADLGPYKPTRIAHPTMLTLCSRHFDFNQEQELTEEFVATVKEYGYTLELNTAGLGYPEDCDEISGQSLLPYIKKYGVPVALGADAHAPQRVGEGFDHPVIQENLKDLRPVWEADAPSHG